MVVVRLKYDIGITLVIARKAKMIAKAIVDGDVVRQYCYLEAYGEELKHVCAGNNYKFISNRTVQWKMINRSKTNRLSGEQLGRIKNPTIGQLKGAILKKKSIRSFIF